MVRPQKGPVVSADHGGRTVQVDLAVADLVNEIVSRKHGQGDALEDDVGVDVEVGLASAGSSWRLTW